MKFSSGDVLHGADNMENEFVSLCAASCALFCEGELEIVV